MRSPQRLCTDEKSDGTAKEEDPRSGVQATLLFLRLTKFEGLALLL